MHDYLLSVSTHQQCQSDASIVEFPAPDQRPIYQVHDLQDPPVKKEKGKFLDIFRRFHNHGPGDFSDFETSPVHGIDRPEGFHNQPDSDSGQDDVHSDHANGVE